MVEPPALRTPCCCFERATTLAPGPCQGQGYPTKQKKSWEDTWGYHFFANIAKCNLFIYNSTRFWRAKLVPANFYIAPVNLSEKRVPPSPVASNSCNDLPHEHIKKYWRTIPHFNDSFGNWNHKMLLYFALNLPILMVKWPVCTFVPSQGPTSTTEGSELMVTRAWGVHSAMPWWFSSANSMNQW